MSKKSSNKEKYKRYSSSGRKEANAARRKANAEKRVAKFAKRREDGKTYEWKPNPFDPKKQKNQYYEEARRRSEKNVDHRDPISRFKSIMRRLQNELDKKEKAVKKVKQEAVSSTSKVVG